MHLHKLAMMGGEEKLKCALYPKIQRQIRIKKKAKKLNERER